MNIKLIALTFFTLTCFSNAFAAQKNLCDELIASGTSTPDQIQKCHDKLGLSDFYKAEQEKDKKAAIKKSEAAIEAEKKQGNIETKKFTQADLDEAGFGKPFYAVTDDYRNYRYKQTRITEGDSLCNYLGYEKALKSIISAQINQEDSNKKGLIIDTGFFGGVKPPTIYKQDDPRVGVRKYVEITCVKRKDKEMASSTDALKAVVESLIVLDETINTSPTDSTTKIYDKTGTKKIDSTPHGYKEPEWMKATPATTIQK